MSTATEPKKNEQKTDLSANAVRAIADNAKPKETKAEKFRRLANRRVPRALKLLRHVQNLAGKGNYEYSEIQAAKIVNALIDGVNKVKLAFAGTAHEDNGFSV